MNKRRDGLTRKFDVRRVDGTDAPGQKHDQCCYFVLDLTHDQHAIPALAAYARSCRAQYPALSADLQEIADGNKLMPYRTMLSSSGPEGGAQP